MTRFLSLFSGIEAASVAWKPLGWECVGVAEIEPFPCAVLAHHYPGVPNLGSVTDITDEDIKALGPIDIVVGGSPCQDLSVAGKGQGLAGERSGLFFDQIRIFNAARSLCGARFLFWENVPGAFSTNKGRDFAEVVGAFTGTEFDVPPKGWQTSGAAIGPDGFCEWSVLDAQHFGVPQRRRRIFALLDSGNWLDRGPILFNTESMRRDFAARGKTGEKIAPTVGTGAPYSRTGNGSEVEAVVMASGQANAEIAYNRATTLQCLHEAPVVVRPIDASFGRLQGYSGQLGNGPVTGAQGGDYVVDSRQVTSPENRSNPQPGDPSYPLSAKPEAPLLISSAVRRLTPRECERLQGFPDDWTLIPYRNKPAEKCPDGPRYKALGNSMAVPVMRWIGEQLNSLISDAAPEKPQSQRSPGQSETG